MKIALHQRQTLKMVMTTELRQAIELLQLSTYELSQFVHEQAEENPFIELNEKEESFTDDRRSSSNNAFSSQRANPIDFAATNEKSMHDYLIDQITLLHLNDNEFELIRYLILNVNDEGYLVVSDDEVMERLQVDEAKLYCAKEILYGLEPIGIGADNLAHCLSIQAKVKYPGDELLVEVIENYLQLIADKQWNKLAKKLDITLSEIKALFEKIQTLDPKPAASLASTRVDYVTPDIVIEAKNDLNEYTVQLNDYYVPNITFNNEYSTHVTHSKELSQYVNSHFKKFEWLQQSIEQRRMTILKIMQVIVSRQQKFLQHGFQSLKPLTLKEVADEIDMHESTVSRATANKIVQTPIGTFELRRLFSTKLTTQTGNNTSQTKVKAILKEIITNENKYKPLSDQGIADRLKEKEIVISRRTVAKYRGELNIPPSSKRKEIKIYAE